jgi:hypothetical protein
MPVHDYVTLNFKSVSDDTISKQLDYSTQVEAA